MFSYKKFRASLKGIASIPVFLMAPVFAAIEDSTLHAVQLAEIFRDQLVLQRDVPVRIWGTGKPGEKVEVHFAGQKSGATIDAQSRWTALLAPMPASAESRTMVVRGNNAIEVQDVLVGDVWLAGGQSNMGSRMNEYLETVSAEIPRANYPLFRVFTVDKREHSSKPPSADVRWEAVSPATAGRISATAYFFGRDLHRHLQIPIGIVVCAWGGTLAENWISRETLASHPETKPIIDRFDAIAASYGSQTNYQAALAEYRVALAAWKEVRKRGNKGGPGPKQPMGPEHFQRPAGLFETMFKTIVPFAAKGIIFYQGESNVVDGRSYQYRFLLPLLVKDWRRELGADLPFLTVQLPVIKGQHEDEWAEMRESQAIACRELENCEMAVVLEFGELNRLHPHGKEGVGARLAMLARGTVYGEPIVCRGPLLRSHRIEGDRLILEFDSMGSALVAHGDLKDFTICDASRQFVPAQASIIGQSIEIFSDRIAAPLAARYGWKNFFEPSLFNRDGFSAAPFRTDTFMLKTEKNR